MVLVHLVFPRRLLRLHFQKSSQHQQQVTTCHHGVLRVVPRPCEKSPKNIVMFQGSRLEDVSETWESNPKNAVKCRDSWLEEDVSGI